MKHLKLKTYSSKTLSAMLATLMLTSCANAMISDTDLKTKPSTQTEVIKTSEDSSNAPDSTCETTAEIGHDSSEPVSEVTDTEASETTSASALYASELNAEHPLKGQSKFATGIPIPPVERADRDAMTGKNITPGTKNPNQVNFDSGARFYMLTTDKEHSSRRDKCMRFIAHEKLLKAQQAHDTAMKNLERQKLTEEERAAKIKEIEDQLAKAQKFYRSDIKSLEEVQRAEANNIELYKYLSEHPGSEMAKLPCEVVYDAVELDKQERTGTTCIFRDPKCRDNLSVALKVKEELREQGVTNPKVLVLDAASEVTVGGAPAITGMAAEESMERATALYAWLTGGDMDHYYIQNDAENGVHGFHYNPNKCALAKNVPVYLKKIINDDGTITFQREFTKDETSTLDTVDFMVHASRNMNSACCEQMPCILPGETTKTTTGPIDTTQYDEEFFKEIQESANQMIKLAVSRGYNAIVINNLGGGVFMNGVSAWASAWANAIKDFGGNLNVSFAIFDGELGKNGKIDKLHPVEPDANKPLLISDIYANALRAQGIEVTMN